MEDKEEIRILPVRSAEISNAMREKIWTKANNMGIKRGVYWLP